MNGYVPFLRAEWRDLAILNFEIEPVVLETLVPRGLELDSWQGRHYISLIGFRFVNTRVFGVPIPFHRDFDEVNCRFYVRRRAAEGWRHGVVFIKELVPRRLIALAARVLDNEPYVALQMRHRFERGEWDGVPVRSLTYAWMLRGRENSVSLTSPMSLSCTREGSDAAFFAERYWDTPCGAMGLCSSITWSVPAGRSPPPARLSLPAVWQPFMEPDSCKRWTCRRHRPSLRQVPKLPCREASRFRPTDPQ